MDKQFWIIVAILATFCIAFWGAIGYVALHFITKWW